jgi:hypothetical protein
VFSVLNAGVLAVRIRVDGAALLSVGAQAQEHRPRR